jgi:DNA-binding ferritin-like protein
MNKLQQTLSKAFSTNFLLYYSSHVAHVNTTGRNFAADHELLGKIYEDAQDQIDTYAEFLRTIQAKMPDDLATVITKSEIGDEHTRGSATTLLKIVYENVEIMLEVLDKLYREAEHADELGLANYAQDRMTAHKKFCWMLRSIVGEEAEGDQE